MLGLKLNHVSKRSYWPQHQKGKKKQLNLKLKQLNFLLFSFSWTDLKNLQHLGLCVIYYGQIHWKTSATRKRRNILLIIVLEVAHISIGKSGLTKWHPWIANPSTLWCAQHFQTSGSHHNIKTVILVLGISIIKIRRSWDRLIFIMGISYTSKMTSLYWDRPLLNS